MILFKLRKSTYLFLFLLMNFQLFSCAQKVESETIKNKNREKDVLEIKTGAERTNLYLSKLKGKNIAIVANQTSVLTVLQRAEVAPNVMGSKKVSQHLVDYLHNYNGIKVQKVFAPEHGFRGKADAAELVKDGIDKKTGLPIVSLYGKSKKPSKKQLEGIDLDVGFLNSLSEALNNDIDELQNKIYKAAGEEFNIASPKQLGIILFEKLKLVDKPKKTKTGQYATSEDILSYLAKDHDIIRNILEYRGLAKLKSTYVDALPLQVEPTTGRVHTDYMQTVAATGRLSSNNPNLQNIPIRTERGRQVRKAFIPRDKNHTLLAADYSQIELRVIAALSEEETMINAFKNGEDIHASTASKVFNVPLSEVTREQRSNAKTVNFGIIYGVSAFGLSNQTDLNRTEAKQLIDTYYETYPKLKAYISKQVDFARDNGYVETVLGRRRYLKDINSRNAVVRGAAERNAVNAPIQGSAADIIKIAMINIYNKLQEGNYKTKMLLQVHDELVFDVYKPELDTIKSLVKTEMENAYQLKVPLDVDLDIGDNWLEAH